MTDPIDFARNDAALLAAVFETADSVIIGLRPDRRVFLWNAAAEALYQTPREQAIGIDYVERFIAPEHRELVAADIREVLAGKRTRNFVDDSILPDGRRRTLQWNVSPMTIAEGETVGIVAIGRDITQEHEADERFRAIFAHTTDGLLIADDSGVIDANPAALAMLGMTDRSQLVGRRVAEFSPPTQPDGHPSDRKSRSLGAETLSRGALTFEWVHRSVDGRDVPVEVSVRHATLAGRRVSVVSWHDLTRQRALEAERTAMRDRSAAAQRLEAVGRLAAGIAHDFNNLLTVMRNATELARDLLPAGHPALEELEPAQRANAHAATLARQLLAFARERPPAHSRLELGDVVRGVLPLARSVATGVTLETTLPGDAVVVEADRTELEQVVFNLVLNARDALREIPTSDARIEICVSTDGESATLSVQDSGIGMDEATRERAFEPFFTTKPIGEGTGLGLAVVYGVATRLRGTVTIDSAPAAGTTVHVRLPIAAAPAPVAASAPVATAPQRPRRVLLVDDDDGVRRSTRRLLERDGWEVVEAVDGEDGLQTAIADPSKFGIVVSDVRMPRLDGRALAARLAEDAPTLPVVLYSGFEAEAVDDAGGVRVRVIPKPFTRAVLRAEMALAMGGGGGGAARGAGG